MHMQYLWVLFASVNYFNMICIWFVLISVQGTIITTSWQKRGDQNEKYINEYLDWCYYALFFIMIFVVVVVGL